MKKQKQTRNVNIMTLHAWHTPPFSVDTQVSREHGCEVSRDSESQSQKQAVNNKVCCFTSNKRPHFDRRLDLYHISHLRRIFKKLLRVISFGKSRRKQRGCCNSLPPPEGDKLTHFHALLCKTSRTAASVS